jgi:hypothetical protein
MMMNLNELRKVPAYRGKKHLPAKAILICGEPTPHKKEFRTLEAMILKNFGPFSPTTLAPFIEKVKKNRKERS